jgi:hypothetical protein
MLDTKAKPSTKPAEITRKVITTENIIEIVLLSILGIAELVSSGIVLTESNQYFIGGIYLGVLAVVVAVIRYIKWKSQNLFASMLLIIFVCSVASNVLQGISWNDVSKVESCSIYSSGSQPVSSRCTPGNGHYTCVGDKDLYSQAESCAVTYQNGFNDNVCSCVQFGTSTCLVFEGLTSCGALVSDKVKDALLTSFVFSLIISVASLIHFIKVVYIIRSTPAEDFSSADTSFDEEDQQIQSKVTVKEEGTQSHSQEKHDTKHTHDLSMKDTHDLSL